MVGRRSLSHVSVYSNASMSGFGATHGENWVAGGFSIKEARKLESWLGHHYANAKDAGCKTDNINVLELWLILVGGMLCCKWQFCYHLEPYYASPS